MITKKEALKSILVLTIFLGIGVASISFTGAAETCPANTTAGETQATLVGEITDDGGDPNLEAWFQYGKTISYAFESLHFSKNGIGPICTTVYNLDACTTYNYRAIAKNSAGTSYGDNKSFSTQCLPVTANLKANNSDGPISVSYKNNVTFSWTSQNAASCQASGNWTGAKAVSGSETMQMNLVGTNTFTITCRDAGGTKTGVDSVTVIVTPNPPVVITKPAVITY